MRCVVLDDEEGTVSIINAPLDWMDIKQSAAQFVIKYKSAKSENSQKQAFWIDFFKIFGVSHDQVGLFEAHVKKLDNHDGWIDYFWPGKLIIEHKSRGEDLDRALFQAYDYAFNLPKSETPRYFIVSDFARIWLVDMQDPSNPLKIKLTELVDNIDSFGFIAGYNKTRVTGQHPVNIKAAEKMGELYDHLRESNYPIEYVDKYLIRLVFCLFAEDSGLFARSVFSEYIASHSVDDGSNVGPIINSMFEVLDTEPSKRQKSMNQSLSGLPYVNGGLFRERLPSAYFDRAMRDCIISSAKLNWKEISPAIFGSLFQCVMDPAQRREMGAHYTSEENILRLINPLFMDDLRAEFESIRNDKIKLKAFATKLSTIKIIDPACGCGNFLIISFRELRYLEMDVFEALYGESASAHASRISVDNFYGIEYEPFPVQIAQVAMWLMEHITNLHRMEKFGNCDSIIPLKSHANIIHGNSLTIDWESVVDPKELTYIVGNPPFVGAKTQTDEQRADMARLFDKNAGILDYVSGWYIKAARMMQKNPKIRTAFVSTNSITQGEQVEPLWKPIFDMGIKINFAYKTFRWNNEARGKAAVHVIIVAFSYYDLPCRLYSLSNGLTGDVICKDVDHINAYLVGGDDVFVTKHTKPICDVPMMETGCQPIDGGNYLFDESEMKDFIAKEPKSKDYFHPIIGSKEFINRIPKYCLWLGNCPASELRSMPTVYTRVENVRQFRSSSNRAQTKRYADMPTHFCLENMPETEYIVMPKVSSENRDYIPIGFLEPNVFCTDLVYMVPNASLYTFGVLTSDLHMVWTRYVCGRLKSDYRYSIGIVYNNFPWPDATDNQKARISEAAKGVLEVRDKYADQSYADLYDPLTMPPDLLKAHQKLDKEVEKAYRKEPFVDDDDRITFLFDLYRKLTSESGVPKGQTKL